MDRVPEYRYPCPKESDWKGGLFMDGTSGIVQALKEDNTAIIQLGVIERPHTLRNYFYIDMDPLHPNSLMKVLIEWNSRGGIQL